MKITLINISGDTGDVLIGADKKRVEERKKIARKMYPKEHIKIKEKILKKKK